MPQEQSKLTTDPLTQMGVDWDTESSVTGLPTPQGPQDERQDADDDREDESPDDDLDDLVLGVVRDENILEHF